MLNQQVLHEIPPCIAPSSRHCDAGQINEIREPFCYERPSEPEPKVMRSVERRRRRKNRLMAH